MNEPGLPSPSLENTRDGIVERIDPFNVPPGILAIHSVRYRFAVPHCRAKTVADIACGAGYGAAILADVAAAVVGGDADQGAIDFARAHYERGNLRFEHVDALQMSFADGSFDVLVSFETIEHLADIERFLRECVRVLLPGGTFIVSTPLVPETNRRPANPHHTVEFSLVDFRALLTKHFASVELYGQTRVQTNAHRMLQRIDVFGLRHRIPGFVRRRATLALATVPFEEMGVENQQIVRDEFRNAHDVIAVCTTSATGHQGL